MAIPRLGVFVLLLTAWHSSEASSQEAVKSGFTTVRPVQLPAEKHPEIVVTEFYTHGEVQEAGSNLAVTTATEQPVAWRMLQVGPGDFCRLAFQTVAKKSGYKIHYGGSSAAKSPPWTLSTGLLMETRRWKPCDLGQAKSVRSAFESAQPLGADFVAGVFHGYNPFRPEAEPFLTRYHGNVEIPKGGSYQFFTSSQDCSFVSIDGKVVVAAPGARAPVGDARIRGTVQLSAGTHTFEYLHAASGSQACMVAAWQPPGSKQPEPIPAHAFRSNRVLHIAPGPPRHLTRGLLPDLALEVLSQSPALDEELPLIRVQFRTQPSPGAKHHWDFGDGQQAAEASPAHVFLHPGQFTVKVKSPAASKGQECSYRVHIFRGLDLPRGGKTPDQLNDYLPMLARYDAVTLDPLSALQLIRFSEHVRQFDRAGKVAKSWLLTKPPPENEAIVYEMVRVAAPLLRDRQDDLEGAFALWEAGLKATRRPDWKARCELEAADSCLHDLHKRAQAGKFLSAAESRLLRLGNTALVGRLHRIWGDYHARAGDRKAALAAYTRAEQSGGLKHAAAEREARRGARSRSTESFLREKSLDRARDELRLWQDEFPLDKVEGYWSFLQARCYFEKGKYAHAIVTANDLLAVNPESAHADQILFQAGECEEKLLHSERAQTAFKALIADYPGSPLVASAKKKIK